MDYDGRAVSPWRQRPPARRHAVPGGLGRALAAGHQFTHSRRAGPCAAERLLGLTSLRGGRLPTTPGIRREGRASLRGTGAGSGLGVAERGGGLGTWRDRAGQAWIGAVVGGGEGVVGEGARVGAEAGGGSGWKGARRAVRVATVARQREK